MDMKDIVKEFDINAILGENNLTCQCGKRHTVSVKDVVIERGAIARVPGLLKKYGGSRPFLIADRNTFKAAGEAVCDILSKDKLPYSQFVFEASPEPDEFAVGQVVMQYDPRCDFILGVGSGTINDICKIIAHATGLPYLIVGTAPFDGRLRISHLFGYPGWNQTQPEHTLPYSYRRRFGYYVQSPAPAFAGRFGRYACKIYQYLRMAYFSPCHR